MPPGDEDMGDDSQDSEVDGLGVQVRGLGFEYNSSSSKLGGRGASGWAGRCEMWVEEMRSSLRGRRLFALFALVHFVNYMDRGVRYRDR